MTYDVVLPWESQGCQFILQEALRRKAEVKCTCTYNPQCGEEPIPAFRNTAIV